MRQKGLDGELLAENFLKKKGYRIITTNFHSRFGEIDIIAVNNNTLIFVEVKLRTSDLFGTPLESITYSKLEKIKKTAYYFLTIHNMADKDFRFDAVEVVLAGDTHKINHLENITL